ncbi:MAG: mevalonate kinase [Bacteroidetes bacterium]|jgi:mevalonate kinase|nr:mevalonate kinase [Bacteroidota bacterium]
MEQNEQAFHSKILLFGEYSIIQESMGLSVPYKNFEGQLTFSPTENLDPNFTEKSNEHLLNFSFYLKEKLENKELEIDFDLIAFQKDIENGIFFESNIPQGFGVGSSGALVAAVYHRYALNKIDLENDNIKENILLLKSILAKMESYFHGSSSGVDPLICYLNLPLLITSKNNIEPVKVSMKNGGKGAIFLIDTGLARKTEPLVKYYMERMEEGTYREFVEKQLKPFTNNCIQAFLAGDHETLFGYLTKLSKFQFEHFKPMIPKLFNKIWKRGLDSGEFYLKLCGAGGGGYILGFTQNYEKAQKHLKGHKVEVLCAL